MTEKTRTEAEAIADIRAALCSRMHAAERFYNEAQRHFRVGSPERREARAVLEESKVAYSVVKQIAETAIGPVFDL